MRIGIIMYHRAVNFDTALQVYALPRFLSALGHDVYIIDYFRTASRSKKLFTFHVRKAALGTIYRNPCSEPRRNLATLRCKLGFVQRMSVR